MKKNEIHLKEVANKGLNVLSFLYAALAGVVVLYYIIFQTTYYVHSDYTDTLLWAWASLDAKSLLSPTFQYAAILPFAGNLLMLPFVALFGYTVKAHMCGMVLFACLFMLALWYFLSAFEISNIYKRFVFATVLLVLSSSIKLREIMWGHIIYYSLGILVLLLLFGLLFRLLQYNAMQELRKNKKAVLQVILLFILTMCVATNGAQVLVFCTLPVMAAILAEVYFNIKQPLLSKKQWVPYLLVAVMGAGTLIGFIWRFFLQRGITSAGDYASGYMTGITPVKDWMMWAGYLPEHWLTLLGVTEGVNTSAELFGIHGLMLGLQLIGVAVITIVPIIATVQYRKYESRELHMLLWAHWVITAVVVASAVIGQTGDANWRFTPAVATGVLVTGVYLWGCVQKEDAKRMATLAMAGLVGFGMMTLKNVAKPPVLSENGEIYQLIEVLEENELHYGYSTFWVANKANFLASGKVEMYAITLDANTISAATFQTDPSWYETQAGVEKYYLVLTLEEYSAFVEEGNLQETYADILIEVIEDDAFIILVFDENPVHV